MNSQSDLRLGGSMLFVATLICGGFAVAALWPVFMTTSWHESASPAKAATSVAGATKAGAPKAGPNAHSSAPRQAHAAVAPQQRAGDRRAQQQRLAEQERIRRQMQQQAARRHHGGQTIPASRPRGSAVATTSGSQRTIQRSATRGTTTPRNSSHEHGARDAQHNEVYVPVNVHPVTVNVDGSAMTGEVARLADSINQVLMAQREAARIPQQPVILQTIPQVIPQVIPQPMLRPVEETPDPASQVEAERLALIDASLRDLAASFETLRSETHSAVAGISRHDIQTQATSQLLAEYRLALEQQRERLLQVTSQPIVEDVTARISIQSLSGGSRESTSGVSVPEETRTESVPMSLVTDDTESRLKPVELPKQPELDPRPEPIDEPIVAVAEMPPEPELPQEEEFNFSEFEFPAEPEAADAPAIETAVVEEVTEETEETEALLIPVPEELEFVELPEPEESIETAAEMVEFDERSAEARELESWIADNAIPQRSIEEVPAAVAVATRETQDEWDLDVPAFDVPDWDVDESASIVEEGSSTETARRGPESNNDRTVRAVTYEQMYPFPVPPADGDRQVRPVRRAVSLREKQQVSQIPAKTRVRRVHRQAPPQNRNPGIVPFQRPVASGMDAVEEFGESVRRNATRLVNELPVTRSKSQLNKTKTTSGPGLVHRMKSAIRSVGNSQTVR